MTAGAIAGRHRGDSLGDTIRMVSFFVRSYPLRALVMVGCICLAGLAEGLSISLFFPLIQLMSSPGSVPDPALSLAVRKAFDAVAIEPRLGPLLLVIVVTMVVKGVLTWAAMSQAGYAIANVATDLRMELIAALMKSRWGYFVTQPSGQVANAIASEALKASRAYQCAARVAACLIQILVYTVLAVLVSWYTAVLALLTGALILLVLNRLVVVSRRAGKQQTALLKSLTGRLVDAVNGIKPLKAMGQEGRLLPMFRTETEALNDAQRQEVLASVTVAAAQEPLMAVALAAGLYGATTLMGVPFTSLLMLAFLFTRLVNQVNALTQHYQLLVTCEAAFWSIRDRIEAVKAEGESSSGTKVIDGLRDGVVFRSVGFDYGHQVVLRDVSLRFPAGKWVGIVGPSGAGKTTIIDLLAGLYRPVSGEILVDGVPLAEADLPSWRRLIGYVPQEMFLFHDTVYRNIVLTDDSVSRGAVEAALREAGAWEFVQALPAGIDTVVGERGARLSGGQRQRIAIARALVRKPALLILDEVTASLDPEAEAGVCATLAQLRGTVAIVSVSHQRALTAMADVVYRLADGGAVEERDPRGEA